MEGTTPKDSNTLPLPGISLLYSGFEQQRKDLTAAHPTVAMPPASARSSERIPADPGNRHQTARFGLRSKRPQGCSASTMALFYKPHRDTLIRKEVDER